MQCASLASFEDLAPTVTTLPDDTISDVKSHDRFIQESEGCCGTGDSPEA